MGLSFILTSPFLVVESSAVTDDPIDLDITDPAFIEFINEIKQMNYYDIKAEDINPNIAEEVEEIPPLTEDVPPVETP